MNNLSTPEALDMLTEISGVPDIGPETEFGALGVDSIMLVEWISRLEEKLDVDLNIRDLDIHELSSHSISDVLDTLRSRAVSA
jgi:acyl carrier protein